MMWSSRATLGVLVVGMVSGTSLAVAAPVDPAVRAEIANTGTATYMLYFDDRPELGDLQYETDREARGRHVLERLQTTAKRSQDAVLALLESLTRAGEVSSFRSHFIANVVVVTSSGRALDRLAQHPDVERVEPVRRHELPDVAPSPVRSASRRAVEWNVARMGAPAAWSAGATGEGVVVATLDTGARYTHQSIVGQYRGNLGGGNFSHDYNWYDAPGLCPPGEPCDDNGYGTGILSLAVGDDGGANQVGVAPGARWITARGCESASCSDASLLAGAEWLLAPCPVGLQPGDPDCDPDMRPHMVAIGWSGGGADLWFQDAVNAWRAAGIVPLVMAGNSGPSSGSIGSPACYCNVIAVGAVDASDIVLSYSSRGPGPFACAAKPELVTPADQVRVATAGADDAYSTMIGTGPAAAGAAGCAALVLSAAPGLDPVELRELLLTSADDVGPAGFDYDTGWGIARCDLAIAGLADMVFVDDFERGSAGRWSSQTPAGGTLYLFDGGGVVGAIGGRAGADAMCAGAVSGYPGVPTAHVRALLTVDADDEIRDMPALYDLPTDRRVINPSGEQLAQDWADLLDGSIDQPLIAAGVLTTTSFWYSGSTVFGTVAPTTCSGWTDGSTLFDGRYGYSYDTDGGWMSRHNATCGAEQYHVLCLAWE